MASPEPKQLGQLLKEQQEPFDLEDYLHEREYMKANLKPQASYRCCSANSRSFLKRMKATQTCSKIVKPLFKRLLCVRNSQRLKSLGTGDGKDKVKKIGKSNSKRVESDRLSSASCTTVFDSCSESDAGDDEPDFSQRDSLLSSTANTSPSFKLVNPRPQEKQVVTDKNARWRCREDNKELSPVSVLDEISSEETSLDQDNRERIDTSTAIPSSIFMENLWMDDNNVTTSHDVPVSCSSSSCYKNLTATRILQQSKQFLFDFVREFVESRKRRRQDEHDMEFPGHEQLEKILCEDMRRWNKLSGKEFDITELLSSDFKDSVAEWRDYEQQIMETSYVIGDAILEDMIGNEIVVEDTTELLRWHSCLIT